MITKPLLNTRLLLQNTYMLLILLADHSKAATGYFLQKKMFQRISNHKKRKNSLEIRVVFS